MSTSQISATNVTGISESSVGTFEYPHLPNDGDHFRLIKFFTDHDNAPIRCELFTAKQKEWEQQYFALSYVWGAKEHAGQILVNGRRVEVRRNLLEFLTVFRRHARINQLPWAIIWIDAICIDQQTVAEKNHQVQVMGSIFRNAVCVLAWLGQGEAKYEHLLNDIANNVRKSQHIHSLMDFTYANAY